MQKTPLGHFKEGGGHVGASKFINTMIEAGYHVLAMMTAHTPPYVHCACVKRWSVREYIHLRN